jgi:3-oxoacyl-[acyl-carrier-protein] synthase II
MIRKRVVITGIGLLTSVAKDIDSFSTALKNGTSGIKKITTFDVSQFSFQEAGVIDDFVSTDCRSFDRVSLFAMEAAKQAIRDAMIDCMNIEREKIGAVIGTNCGGIGSLEKLLYFCEKDEMNMITPSLVMEFPFHRIVEHVKQEYDLRGPTSTVSIACASGVNAIGYASDFIRYGKADLMLAVAADIVTIFTFSGFYSLRSIAKDKCRPFDKNRSGLVLGEGAGILILESMEHALKRGAKIYGEMAGYGLSNDAFHATKPDKSGKGLSRAMRASLEDAGIKPEDVDYINVHGTGTRDNDVMECNAIKLTFGEYAYKLPISSIKPVTGHTLGAAGIVELMACLLAIRDKFVPPTINYETPDPECDLDVVPNFARDAFLDVVMSTSSGFAGSNGAVIVKRFSEG